ncbi:MAG TPA: oxygenase MpaB family protein [Marmoricola sp.]|nr:oxygenase MpaB family protein [Marmoricola sp.]
MTSVLDASISNSLPARHPDAPLHLPPMIRILATRYGVRPTTDAEFRRLGECLTVGDEPMDRLVDWMFVSGRKQGRALFEQALAGGIDTVPDAPMELREFFESIERTPDWVDWDLLERGARALRSTGSDGQYVARDVALQGGYQFAGFNQTLLRTGALQKGSNQRWAETMRWGMDVAKAGAMRPGGVGFQGTVRVRMIHAFVRRHVAAMDDWDAAQWGLPINQTDMAATIHGSFYVPVTAGMGLGMIHTPRNLDAVAHFTRYVGWLIGVTEEFLPKDFAGGVRMLTHTLSALATPDETSRLLAMPMADDPLSWNFGRLQWMRRRIARSQHLSVLKGAMGAKAMRELGLPVPLLPWYPAVRFPINLVRSGMALLPGGLERAADRGSREADQFMLRLNAKSEIGGSIAGLRQH